MRACISRYRIQLFNNNKQQWQMGERKKSFLLKLVISSKLASMPKLCYYQRSFNMKEVFEVVTLYEIMNNLFSQSYYWMVQRSVWTLPIGISIYDFKLVQIALIYKEFIKWVELIVFKLRVLNSVWSGLQQGI